MTNMFMGTYPYKEPNNQEWRERVCVCEWMNWIPIRV